MQFTVCEDTGVEIFLRSIAEVFVLSDHLLEEFANAVELLI
jgi:tartrate dehydratase alpha subunit/fumarate hydratase class I-like protein